MGGYGKEGRCYQLITANSPQHLWLSLHSLGRVSWWHLGFLFSLREKSFF